MPTDVLQRPEWCGEPKELGELFRLCESHSMVLVAKLRSPVQ